MGTILISLSANDLMLSLTFDFGLESGNQL